MARYVSFAEHEIREIDTLFYSNKSTYCATMMTHCQTAGRKVHLVNLDPAAENFEYEPTIDIRELITLEDVMEELDYGPNGGLIYCLE